MTYRPSVKDITFCLDHVFGMDRHYGGSVFPDFDADVRDAVLEAAGQLAADVLAPLNRAGDLNGTKLDGDRVVVAPGFLDAIKTYADGGWYGVNADPAYGGQGLPKMLEQACFDMFHGANMAFTLLPTLSQGAIEAIHAHGTQAQKDLYLPKLIAGQWSGTMNLTEPQAGSDLAALTTRAEPNGDGTYALTGQKIFITWGEHDGAENIVHLVLARLPDAPKGTRGISLFLCPKFNLDSDGNPGARNAAKCVGLEHKLGIHGSPTCVMAFEGATAELIGAPHGGLTAMFTMMNAARLAVGFEGVGVADAAWQKAQAYARERRQGRSLITGEDSAPIFDHPDVRLMLALMKAKTEAARAICTAAACAIDEGRLSPEDAARAKRREDFLVPIAKAWATDTACEVASMGVQVHGGMGFIEETGAAQYYRDARIAPIYEGTNGIQAADLTGRKLGSDGTAAKELAQDIQAFLSSNLPDSLKVESEALGSALSALNSATDHLLAQKAAAPLNVAAAATSYLKLCGDVIGGWYLLKGAVAAEGLIAQSHGDAEWLKDRGRLMRVYYGHVLPHAQAHLAAITSGFNGLEGLTLSLD